jgi:P-type Cu2+ transporter
MNARLADQAERNSDASRVEEGLRPYIEAVDGISRLNLLVDGMHCGGCVNRIESALEKETGVVEARANLTTRRLSLAWREDENDAGHLMAVAERLGFHVVPFDPEKLLGGDKEAERELLRSLAVAGFAAANVMLLSVAIWAGHFQDMGPATRGLMHWISALIALPAIAYAGIPFFRSALGALRGGRLNMDVPISLAVILSAAMSLFETYRGGEHAYFDSAVTLLFFLLIGRYLDCRARGRARSAVENLTALAARAVTVIEENGATRSVSVDVITPGTVVLVAPGDRIPVDGEVVEGATDIDTSLITGESAPESVAVGDRVFAGMVNLTGSMRVAVKAVGEGTLLAEIARLMEAAESRKSRRVSIADRIVRIYAPAVHMAALMNFVGWMVFTDISWQVALTYAIAVLIVTCPCALALAVPVVQVVASGSLMRKGVLLKSGIALEQLAEVDTFVFDKTGTLTLGRPELVVDGSWNKDDLRQAAIMASASHHPLARALAAMSPGSRTVIGVEEVPGSGLRLDTSIGERRLGSRTWCGVENEDTSVDPELWFVRPGHSPVRFRFRDQLRGDTADTLQSLKKRGYVIELLSGDRADAVAHVADKLGIETWRAAQTPTDKTAYLEELREAGRKTCMVGDGLNDAPALAAASVSMSPATAVDISQITADIICQGDRLSGVALAADTARRAQRLIRQNFALAFGYNLLTVPLAMAGLVTPLIAAIAMSASSIAVVLNALRLGWGR